jgi:hypothetical protein
MIVPVWFLYVAGFSLFVLGVLQIQARPRKPSDGFYERFVNVGTLWSLCCMTVGAGILAMALGWWRPSFLEAPKAPPKLHRR